MVRVSHREAALMAVTSLAALFLSMRPTSYAQPNDLTQIRALEDRFANAFKAKDVDGIMANYEHSASLVVFDVVPRREYLGWDAYEKDWEEFFAPIEAITSFEIKDLTVNVGRNLAYSYSFQHHTAKTKAGGLHNVMVRVTDVYRKSGGRWLIVQEHVSVPVDSQTGKADLQFKP